MSKNIAIDLEKTNLSFSKKKPKHYCYLLRSLNQKFLAKTYFGYTTDVNRRLRQHNGEIAGGARKTINFRPWKLVMYIKDFPDWHNALQFEWTVNHCKRSQYPKNLNEKLDRIWNVLCLDFWTNNSTYYQVPLTIVWNEEGLQTPKKILTLYNSDECLRYKLEFLN